MEVGVDHPDKAARPFQRHREYAGALSQQAGDARREPNPLLWFTHPSLPNYLALFSASTQGVTSNACPSGFRRPTGLGHQLRASGHSFAEYAVSLPKVGCTGCISGGYQRKHNPWVNFTKLPASVNRPFSAFPRDYRRLPTVPFVTPNMCDSMHDCSIRTGDRWMKKHLDRYAQWAP